MSTMPSMKPSAELTPEQLAVKNKLVAANKAAANARLLAMYAQLEAFMETEESKKVSNITTGRHIYE